MGDVTILGIVCIVIVLIFTLTIDICLMVSKKNRNREIDDLEQMAYLSNLCRKKLCRKKEIIYGKYHNSEVK